MSAFPIIEPVTVRSRLLSDKGVVPVLLVPMTTTGGTQFRAESHQDLVAHWWEGSQVVIHINGESDEHRALVDRIGDHYSLAPDDGETTNYSRGVHLGRSPVLAFCGRGPQ